MKIIAKQNTVSIIALTEQKITNEEKYRLLLYVKTLDVKDGLLLYNLITEELIFLDDEEKGILKNNSLSELKEKLIKKWFLVPMDFEDQKLYKQFASLKKLFNRANPNHPVTSFVIFPTTDCNARCFYCFELSGNRRSMSIETAKDVSKYIIKKSKGNNVDLRWFGGEPLYNSVVIDEICSELEINQIKYSSTMITNGYLFDENLIARARNKWNLTWVQITLDGTEEIYNRVKAYIYTDGSAFEKVIDNIGKLLNNDISVTVRMNMDDHNANDLYDLTDCLVDRFSVYKKFDVTVSLLFEDSCARIANRSDDNRHTLINSFMKLQKYVSSKGMLKSHVIREIKTSSYCMADSNSCIMILPDGKLGRCQHYTDDHFVGNIYDDVTDFKMVDWFKEMRTVVDECEMCAMAPWCEYPVCCKSAPQRCDDVDKNMRKQLLEKRMEYIYNESKKGEKNETQI